MGILFNLIAAVYLATRVMTKIYTLSKIFEKNTTEKLRSISRELSNLKETSPEFNKKIRDSLIILSEIANRNVTDFNFQSIDTYKRATIGIRFLITGAVLQGIALVIALFTYQ